MTGPSGVPRRDELWLSLVTSFTDRFPRWAVWKNVESGEGNSYACPSWGPA